jgi:glycogen debranching enzyme
MRYRLDEAASRNLETMLSREWVLPNGIGGYAMGTAAGVNTRRYHGHLIAAATPPTGRTLLLAAIDAEVEVGSVSRGISSNQYPGTLHPEGYRYLQEFSVDRVATWRYQAGNAIVEKRLFVHDGTNVVTIEYENCGSNPFTLKLRPLVCHRDHHGNFSETSQYPDRLGFEPGLTTIDHGGLVLKIHHDQATRVPVDGWYFRFEHVRDAERGLDPRDDLYCPCELSYRLAPGEKAVLQAGISESGLPPQDPPLPESSDQDLQAMLTDAASKFFVASPTRTTILAGYPWFTDWGRDTMISIPGLCVATNRIADGRQILRDYASQIRRGLIPNRFVEVGEEPDYNTVDATLWFANAAYKLLDGEWDAGFAQEMLAAITEIYDCHMAGTDFGIKVDPADGLLTQGEPGVQLTWMDAKIGEWVVTPRHGKPVEINGLWINLLRVLAWLHERLGSDGNRFAYQAEEAAECFEQKFWHPKRGHYLDTVDPMDASLRPNQIIAMALPFSPCDPAHARRAMKVVGKQLYTPNGLRTLGPNEPAYRGRFEGPMSERDAVYHQGTVWPWLLGSYATSLYKYCDARNEALRVLGEAERMLQEQGLGGIAEVYDGDAPQRPGGCPWQAWSVAEILRALVEIP